MRVRRRVLAAVLLAAGCGTGGTDAPADAPLTVDEWKALPPDTKYEIDTLERLRRGTPKFQDQREWDRFTREVLLPAKKKEGAGRSPAPNPNDRGEP